MELNQTYIPFEIVQLIAQFCDKREITQLRLVCRDLNAISSPLLYRALVEEISNEGHFHFHRAISRCHLAAISRMLESGASPNQRDLHGEAPLHAAARNNCVSGAQLLLGLHVDVNAQSQTGWTPLHLAARYGHYVFSTVLLEHGATLDTPGFHGWTALHYAARSGHEKMVLLLLSSGARSNCQDNDSKAPTDHARKFRHWGVLNMLCEPISEN